MPGVSKEEVAKAREIDLLSYLQTYEPGSVKKSAANEYRLVEHNSLTISNGKWHWHTHGFGGKDALTFLVKVRGMDFVEAVRLLCDRQFSPVSFSQPINAKSHNKQKSKDEFILPEAYKDNFRAIAYLQKRGIDNEIINRCIKAGTLYEGKNYHNCVFVGKDNKNIPRYANMRSTVNNVRQDAAGSDKRFCFSIPSTDTNARFVMLAEAPIDILSLASIRKMDTNAADKYHYLSLGGISPLALIQYLTDHPKIDHVIVCLDNDKAGIKCMDKIKEVLLTDESLNKRHISVITEPPPEGKDFNDTLLVINKKIREGASISHPKEAAVSK